MEKTKHRSNTCQESKKLESSIGAASPVADHVGMNRAVIRGGSPTQGWAEKKEKTPRRQLSLAVRWWRHVTKL